MEAKKDERLEYEPVTCVTGEKVDYDLCHCDGFPMVTEQEEQLRPQRGKSWEDSPLFQEPEEWLTTGDLEPPECTGFETATKQEPALKRSLEEFGRRCQKELHREPFI